MAARGLVYDFKFLIHHQETIYQALEWHKIALGRNERLSRLIRAINYGFCSKLLHQGFYFCQNR